MTGSQQEKHGLAIFTPCVQSHGFDDRRIVLQNEQNAVKIGRSVARLKPGSDNAIFDCKVLSRNHAKIWYEEGRFYLRDTRSSNGTYVNMERLSRGGEESVPREIFTGDILQFGIDIAEASKQVTYGSIVAMARLLHADGTEAAKPSGDSTDSVGLKDLDGETSLTGSVLSLASSTGSTIVNSNGPSSSSSSVNAQELFQLHQYIREAAHREHMLGQKLTTLTGLLNNTQQASENCWQALINEDRLLSRIEMLETQLKLYSKNAGEDKIRDEMLSLQQEKYKYETTAKESLRRSLQEKTEAVQKLYDVERSLETTEDECARLRKKCDATETELLHLAATNQTNVDTLNTTVQQLAQSERQLATTLERAQWDKNDMQKLLETRKFDLDKAEEALDVATRRLESELVQRAAECKNDDLTQLSKLYSQSKDQSEALSNRVAELLSTIDNYEKENKSVKENLLVVSADLKFAQNKNNVSVKSMENESDNKENEENVECCQLRERMTILNAELTSSKKQTTQLEEERKVLRDRLKHSLNQADEMEAQFSKFEQTENQNSVLLGQVDEIRKELRLCQISENARALEAEELRQRLYEVSDLENMLQRSKTTMLVSTIPLILLFLAFVAAYLPFLSSITSTNEPVTDN